MTPMGFEPTIPAGELPQTYALDRAATGTGSSIFNDRNFVYFFIYFSVGMTGCGQTDLNTLD